MSLCRCSFLFLLFISCYALKEVFGLEDDFKEDFNKIKKWPKSWQKISNKEISNPPFVMTTWAFVGAARTAWAVLTERNGTAIDAAVAGCSYCEKKQCDFTVGYGGSPDETGETTLDAMIIDGDTLDIGAVGDLRRIKNAIGVAKAVLLHSEHTILVGDAATKFATQMGFSEESLITNKSQDIWQKWMNNDCQPNFWKNVHPDSKTSCGPYNPSPIPTYKKPKPRKLSEQIKNSEFFHHDTIGQIVMDSSGSIAAGLSSNGALHKMSGRMGDACIPGAGGFADSSVGAAAATGDGDIMMRFSPSSRVVEKMRHKMSPQKATTQVIKMMRDKYPNFKGGLIAFDKAGNFGAACNGIVNFPFTIARADIGGVKTYYVKCIHEKYA